MALNSAQKKYVQWLAKKDPFLLAVTVKRLTGKTIKPQPQTLEGLAGITDIFSSAVSALKNVNFGNLATTVAKTAASLATTKAQVDIINAQTKRAIAGQPPIDVAPYQPAMTANFNPATASGQMAVETTAKQLNQSQSFNVVKILPWLALGVGAAFLFKKMKG